MPNIAVLGTGYVGICTATGLASIGHSVTCFDIDPNKIELLSQAKSPIHEPGLNELLEKLLDQRNLSFVNKIEEAISTAEFVYICLPTPSNPDGSANLEYIYQSIDQQRELLIPGTTLIVKSTVPVGTASKVKDYLSRDDIPVVSNPEFLREGSAIHDFNFPDRIVIGSENVNDALRVAKLFEKIQSENVITSNESAELIKYVSNAFLAVKLSYVNEIEKLTSIMGISNKDVMRGFELDSRIGIGFNIPGPGWGGSCFPKDTLALIHSANSVGIELESVKTALKTNSQKQDEIVDTILEMFNGDVSQKIITVWGLSFKANTDDVRESPAVAIVKKLSDKGAIVKAYDPEAAMFDSKYLQQITNIEDSTLNSSLLVVLTEWNIFSKFKASKFLPNMKEANVFDTRGVLSDDWKNDAKSFRKIG
jgi:UDPglucose 6-dehydrogenase